MQWQERQTIIHKTLYRAIQAILYPGMKSGAPEGETVPTPIEAIAEKYILFMQVLLFELNPHLLFVLMGLSIRNVLFERCWFEK